jgi:TolA-binding protein
MKTIDFSYFIERYNAGEMDQNERVWFEKELEGNLSLRKEVLLRKRTDTILERKDIISLRTKLVSIEKSRRDELIKKGKLNSPRFRFAAVFTGLIIIGSLMFLSVRTESPSKIFKKYYQSYNNPGVTRSGESTFNSAIDYFNKGEFLKALEGFQAYLENNPGSSHIEFLSGISNMEIMRYRDAELSFIKVINKKINPYTVDANWYLAMCLLATDEKARAKEQLQKIINSGSIYKNKATKILRRL